MSNKNKDMESVVYSTTGFSDLVSSPVFYSVLVLTIILGLSSAFGFFQNPLKLKAVVKVISEKVSLVDGMNKQAVNQRGYLLSNDSHPDTQNMLPVNNIDRYSIFAKSFSSPNLSQISNSSIKPVSFDYDITSRQFWSDLDLSKIESALEESQRKSRDPLIIGIPLELKSPENRNGSIYSLKAGKVLGI